MRPAAGRASALVVACWLLCGAYAWPFVYRGWIAHDEGTLGQSAERVLSGELPHRDFDDVYTGGLSYWHAGGMAALGINLRTMRVMLFGAFLAFLVAVYLIASSVASRAVGALAMALATVWSVPNYFAGLPSWYNLFFATFGILAFLQFLETERRRWLLVAGLAGGVSVLVKIIGVYYIVGGVLALLYVEQLTAPARLDGEPRGRRLVILPGTLLAGGIGAIALAVGGGGLPSAFLPILSGPVLALGFLTWQELNQQTVGVHARLRRVMRLVWPFLTGAALPIAAWIAFYWWNDAWRDLLRGVWVLPQRRLTEAAWTPPPLATLGLAIPYGVLLAAGLRRALAHERLVAVGVATLLTGLLIGSTTPVGYRIVWSMVRTVPIVITVAAIAALSSRRPPANGRDVSKRTVLFLLVVMMGTIGLVQIPYATPTYFCYAAPLSIVAALALVSSVPFAPRRVHAVVAVFVLLFGALFVNRSYGWNLGVTFIEYRPDAMLSLPRGGLQIPTADAQTYERVIQLVSEHSDGGAIYAGPDSPEIYFLAGRRNPTRGLFDLLGSEAENVDWLRHVLDSNGIRVAVINNGPLFSPPLTTEMRAVLEQRLPQARDVGRFTVRFAH